MLHYSKALGTINPVDLMTEYLTTEVNEGHCARLSLHPAEGGAKAAPTPSCILGEQTTWEMESGGVHAVTRHSNQTNTGDCEDDMELKRPIG